jgi:hypothetical protein
MRSAGNVERIWGRGMYVDFGAEARRKETTRKIFTSVGRQYNGSYRNRM